MGGTGDSYDNALAETINYHRLLEPIGFIPPVENEANYWREQACSMTPGKPAQHATLQQERERTPMGGSMA